MGYIRLNYYYRQLSKTGITVQIKSIREHITPTITKLHWLPVQQRINFKLALLTWKALRLQQPSYLAELLNQRSTNGEHNLRDRGIMLVVPPTSTQLGDRAFSCAAPRLWNSLPASVRSSPSLPSFKSNLKTYFFKQAFKLT